MAKSFDAATFVENYQHDPTTIDSLTPAQLEELAIYCQDAEIYGTSSLRGPVAALVAANRIESGYVESASEDTTE